MKPFFNLHYYFVYSLVLCLLTLPSCVKREEGCLDPTALNYNPFAFRDDGSCDYLLEVPSTYKFTRLEGNSVDMETARVHLLLMQDVGIKVAELAQSNANSLVGGELSIYYTQSSHSLGGETLTTISGFDLLASEYLTLASNASALANNTSSIYGADTLLKAALDSITLYSQDPERLGTPAVYTSDSGMDYQQFLVHTLLGSVAYYQGMDKLANLSSFDNANLSTSETYTAMEHQWDLAFGYFGAALDYDNYPDATIIAQNYQDSNADGQIDLLMEYNYAFAVNAMQRDVMDNNADGSDANTNLSEALFEAFTNGRTAITRKDEDGIDFFQSEVITLWELLIASNVVHHLNTNRIAIGQIGTPMENIPLINESWTAAYAYILALQVNENTLLDSDDLSNLISAIGTNPTYPSPDTPEVQTYLVNIDAILNILQNTFSITDFQRENW